MKQEWNQVKEVCFEKYLLIYKYVLPSAGWMSDMTQYELEWL